MDENMLHCSTQISGLAKEMAQIILFYICADMQAVSKPDSRIQLF
jgi:hypothetical protein